MDYILTVKYRYTHKAYGRIYEVRANSYQIPFGIETQHATLDEVYKRIEKFLSWKPAWFSYNEKAGAYERNFNYRCLVNWDPAS